MEINRYPYDIQTSPNLYDTNYLATNVLAPSRIVPPTEKRRYDAQNEKFKQMFKERREQTLHSTFINVDSRNRNKLNEPVISDSLVVLGTNPFQFFKNNNEVFVTQPNHGFTINSRVFITNVSPSIFILDSPFEARKDSSVVRILFPNGTG